MNDDRVIVALERTKSEQAPKREELVLVTVDGGSDLATMAVKFNRGNSRYHLTVKSYESLSEKIKKGEVLSEHKESAWNKKR